MLFEDRRVWEDLPEIAVRRHLPPAVHFLERLCVAAVLRVTGGRGAPALRGRLEELLAEKVVLHVARVGWVQLEALALLAAVHAIARRGGRVLLVRVWARARLRG